jgi:hypothetical protein
LSIFRISAQKIKGSLQSKKMNGYFTQRPTDIYENISPNSS